MREFFDVAEIESAFAYCGLPQQSTHRSLQQPQKQQPQVMKQPENNATSIVTIDDTNASSLCIGLLAQYSRRRCDQLKNYVSEDFRFHFSGGPSEGVDVDYFTHNCDAPNPPEWIEVAEWFDENETSAFWWDRSVRRWWLTVQRVCVGYFAARIDRAWCFAVLRMKVARAAALRGPLRTRLADSGKRSGHCRSHASRKRCTPLPQQHSTWSTSNSATATATATATAGTVHRARTQRLASRAPPSNPKRTTARL